MGDLVLHHPLFHFYLAYVGVLLVVLFCTRERPRRPPRTVPQASDPDSFAHGEQHKQERKVRP
jgi:hypothetical protein